MGLDDEIARSKARLTGTPVQCQACSTDNQATAMRSFTNDEAVYYVCRDVEACEARRSAKAERSLGVTPEMEAAYMKEAAVGWVDLPTYHRRGLQVVIDLARQSPTVETSFAMAHLNQLQDRVKRLERQVDNLRANVVAIVATGILDADAIEDRPGGAT